MGNILILYSRAMKNREERNLTMAMWPVRGQRGSGCCWHWAKSHHWEPLLKPEAMNDELPQTMKFLTGRGHLLEEQVQSFL